MNKLYLWIVVIFGVVGVISTCAVVHEYVHYLALKDITSITEVCLLNMPIKDYNWDKHRIGKTTYIYYVNQTEITQDAVNSSELKGTIINSIMLTIFVFIAGNLIISEEE